MRVSDKKELELVERIARAFTARVMRRITAAGDHSITFDDLVNECWVAYCIARDAYDDASGVPFLAYFQRGMKQHVNRYVEKHVDRRHCEVLALSLDGGPGDAGDDGMTLSEVVPAADPSPDDAISDNEAFAKVLRKLGPREQMFLSLLRGQPQELLEQVRQVSAQAEYGSIVGVRMADPRRLTTSMVFDVMGVNRTERTKILRAVREAASSIQGLSL